MTTSTMKNIAVEAGVSIASVSRALCGKEGIARGTREKINKIAQRLNYFPNLQARALASSKTNSIGIIIPQTSEYVFSNPFYAEVLKGISKRAKESGQFLILSISESDDYAQMYKYRFAGGIIVIGNRCSDPQIESAMKMNIPMILIPGDLNNPRIPSVDVDNINGALKATEYLVKLGHNRIAFLSGPPNSKFSIQRLAGYRKALKINSISTNEDLIVGINSNPEEAYVGMRKLLSMANPPTAVLVINDYSTIGAIRGAKEEGYRVPEDISIIGFGDVPYSSMMDPPLTTVHQPFVKMGWAAAEMLVKLIDGKRLSKRHLIFSAELVIRKSGGPPPPTMD